MARATFAATATALAVAFAVLPSANQATAEDAMGADELLGRFRTIAQEAIDERGLKLSDESRVELDDVLRRGIAAMGGEDAKPEDVARAEENLVALVEAYEVKFRDQRMHRATFPSQGAQDAEVAPADADGDYALPAPAAGIAPADDQTASAAAAADTTTESARAAEAEEPWCPPPRLYPFCFD